MKLVAYLRVSTEGQAEDGFGLEVQRSQVSKWAKLNKHKIVQWCSDEGVSGTLDAVDRAGLACVLEAIEIGTAQALVVSRLDRLARRLHVQEAALAHVWMLGGRAFTSDGGEVLQDDPDDPMRTAMRQMMGVFSELERSMIAKRMRDGRRMKAERGGYAYGGPAFGFRAESRSLVEDDAEQKALGLIAKLHQEGKSLREIAATLTEAGIAPKRSTKWHPETLRKIIARLK